MGQPSNCLPGKREKDMAIKQKHHQEKCQIGMDRLYAIQTSKG